jgi:KipI family sensor histidine kinase inhibitor
VRALRYGSRALLVECADPAQVAALHADLLRRRAAGILPPCDDLVPAELTVLIDGLADPDALARDLADWSPAPAPPGTAALTRIPVDYDGADLAQVAESWQMSVAEAVDLHAQGEYQVAFCGFVPGFAYLTGLPQRYWLPRRATPRTSVPTGSVAVAGPYTGVYPRSSPGGWHLIGTTDAPLWDLARPEPALLGPGARVRFEARGSS